MKSSTIVHVTACEAILKSNIAENTKRNILPSVNKVAQRLLLRGVELNDAYLEVHTKLATEREGLRLFFDGLLNVSAFRSTAINAASYTTSWDTIREGLRLFFDGLLNVSAFRGPKKLASARDARLKLDGLNAEISAKAGELAELLKNALYSQRERRVFL